MVKIYGIDGQTTAIVKVPFNNGTAHIECEFKRGVIGRGPNNRPATFPTSDPAIQSIIESSPYFGHMITLVRISDNGPQRPAAMTPAEPKTVEYPDVTSEEELVAFLKAHGAKAVNLKDDESRMKFAAKIGAIFPNLEK